MQDAEATIRNVIIHFIATLLSGNPLMINKSAHREEKNEAENAQPGYSICCSYHLVVLFLLTRGVVAVKDDYCYLPRMVLIVIDECCFAVAVVVVAVEAPCLTRAEVVPHEYLLIVLERCCFLEVVMTLKVVLCLIAVAGVVVVEDPCLPTSVVVLQEYLLEI
ncbi:hypothetical protein Ahy_B06g081954 isoform B [Arachis hypogaea]|uniref:Uncharacterized protein n=1 Tax=Arachis hypogaea TaxID=3818 RepID=A0A444YMF0_ARAHY|nr:hypothetical protein Ahy_B06g081954 isoform B [Arachis hypogaea]